MRGIDFGPGDRIPADRLSIYLPTKDRHGVPIADHKNWVGEAMMLLTTFFGGATHLKGNEGHYFHADRGVFVKEEVSIVYAYADIERVYHHRDPLKAFIEDFAVNTNQDSVAVEYAGVVHFVSYVNAT